MPSYSTINASDAVFDMPTIAGTALGLTLPAEFSSNGVNSGRAQGQVRTASVVWTANGTAPTDSDATTGQVAAINDIIVLETLTEMRAFSVVRATATSAAINWRYERRID